MSLPLEKQEPKGFIKSVFTPLVSLWLSAVMFGLILPVLSQNIIASWVSNLSSASYLQNGVAITPTLSDFYNSVAFLTAIIILYIIVSCHQAFYVFKIGKYAGLWSLIVTITGPIFVWLVLPALIY